MPIAIERTDADIKCWRVPSELDSMDKLMDPDHDWLFNKASNAMPQANTLVYISGPVSHETPEGMEANLAIFKRAERLLLSLGCHIFNPAHIQGPIDPIQGEELWRYYMHFCIRALPECDSVFFLPDWQNSKGARWEHKLADVLGLEKFYAPVPESKSDAYMEPARDVGTGDAPAPVSDTE